MAMSIALGCNYSAPLKTLLESGSVHVDWIKVSVRERLEEELSDSLNYRPVLIHVLDRAASQGQPNEHITWENLESYVKRAGSPHHALHLALHREDWEGPLDLVSQSPDQKRRMLHILNDGVRRATEQSTVPILVENVPYYGVRGTVRMTVLPETIHAVVSSNGIGMLLDLAHVRVAAAGLGVSERQYLDSLPLDAVREIHVTGPRVVAGEGMRDRHWEMQNDDFDLLEYALNVTNPQVVTLEYGGTGPKFENEERNSLGALVRQLIRLQKILEG